MDEAISVVKQSFESWEEECELHAIRYSGDDCNSEENIQWMNRHPHEGEDYAQCICILIDFHSPGENSGPLEPDMEYTDYQFWFARPDGGTWEYVDSGY